MASLFCNVLEEIIFANVPDAVKRDVFNITLEELKGKTELIKRIYQYLAEQESYVLYMDYIQRPFGCAKDYIRRWINKEWFSCTSSEESISYSTSCNKKVKVCIQSIKDIMKACSDNDIVGESLERFIERFCMLANKTS